MLKTKRLLNIFVRLVHIQNYFYFFSLVKLHIVSCKTKWLPEQHLKPIQSQNALSDG